MGRLSIKQRILKTSDINRRKELALNWHQAWAGKMKRELSWSIEELETLDLQQIFWRLRFIKAETEKHFAALPNVLDSLDISGDKYRNTASQFISLIDGIMHKLNLERNSRNTIDVSR